MADKPARRGRPPKISSADIADAAIRLGIEKATIRSVASELGVSVMGVYHHVRNADDLLELALARKVGALLGEVDRRATFEETLRDAARRYHDLLVRHPEALMRLVRNEIDPLETARYYEILLGAGMASGLDASEAFEAIRSVMAAAAGAALVQPAGLQGPDADIFAVLAEAVSGAEERDEAGYEGSDESPFDHVHALFRARDEVSFAPLEAVDLVLKGLQEKFGPRMTTSIAETIA